MNDIGAPLEGISSSSTAMNGIEALYIVQQIDKIAYLNIVHDNRFNGNAN